MTDLDWTRITAALDGTLDPAERAALEREIASTPALKRRWEMARRIWQGVESTPVPQPDIAAMTRVLQAHTSNAATSAPAPASVPASISAPESRVRVPVMPRGIASTKAGLLFTTRSIGARSAYWLAFAAALLIGVVIPKVWNAGERFDVAASEMRALDREYITVPAQRATLILPDGSHVILGPESQLRYSSTGSDGARVVTMRGQAYFTVAHGAERPFSVRAGETTTRVLGTSFTVRSYADDEDVRVAVAEGRVSVEREHETALLMPGDIATVASNMPNIAVSHDARVADILGWTQGIFTLQDVSLQRAVQELERYYGLDITIADATLAEIPVSIAFSNKSAEDMLRALQLAIGIRYTWNENHVTLSRGPMTPAIWPPSPSTSSQEMM